MWLLSVSRDPFSLDLQEAVPAFVLCSELGGFVFRSTDILALVGYQSVPYSLSIVWKLSQFQCVRRVHF